MEQNQLVVAKQSVAEMGAFSSPETFDQYQRMALALAKSTMVPKSYQGNDNVPNCIVALDIANRLKSSPFLVMQNLEVIQGRPAWKSSYLISVVNTHPRFSGYLEYEYQELGKKKVPYKYKVGQYPNQQVKESVVDINDIGCIAYTMDKSGRKLESTMITCEMAVLEGWWTKDGSKWPTMTKQMLAYRAASFFNRMYCPESTLGMHSAEELQDFVPIDDSDLKVKIEPHPTSSVNEKLKGKAKSPVQEAEVEVQESVTQVEENDLL